MTLLDDLARKHFGHTQAEAHAAARCIRCWEPVDLVNISGSDYLKYDISALCGRCFDEITRDEEETE